MIHIKSEFVPAYKLRCLIRLSQLICLGSSVGRASVLSGTPDK